MKIIILGAGQVGSSLTKSLQKAHDISIVDNNPSHLSQIQNHFDVLTICGSASYPDILEVAGANDADMLIHTTGQ